MKKNINIIEYSKSGFSIQDAKKIATLIDGELAILPIGDTLVLDFSGVKFYTTLFFNTALSRLLENMSIDEYDKRINVIGLTKVGQDAYEHSLNNAKDYYSMNEDQRKKQDQAIIDILNEEQE